MDRTLHLLVAGLVILSLLLVSARTKSDPALSSDLDLRQTTAQRSLTYSGCGGEIAPAQNLDFEQEIVDRTNAFRVENGLPPFKRVDFLDNSARYHATDMAQDEYRNHITHDRVDGELVKVCKQKERIAVYYPDMDKQGENIAWGYKTPELAMGGWLGSTAHHNNILNEKRWEIGVGYHPGDDTFGAAWVQNFGRRFDVYPLIINNEAAETDSVDVSLYIYGAWDELRLRNDDGSWSAWQPFQNELVWTLNSVNGERTVTAEMRNESETVTSSDTINLTGVTTTPVLGNLPAEINFVYSIPEQSLFVDFHQLTPLNTASEEILIWQLALNSSRFTADPTSGATPSAFAIAPTSFSTDTVATYTEVMTVTVTNPAEVLGSPHVISLNLEVIDTPFSRVYLPLVNKNSDDDRPPAP